MRLINQFKIYPLVQAGGFVPIVEVGIKYQVSEIRPDIFVFNVTNRVITGGSKGRSPS